MTPGKPHQYPCVGFRDPRDDFMTSLNMLMVYIGAFAATQYTQDELTPYMDPGLAVHSTVVGHAEGEHNVFNTNYIYFLAAVIVELMCIALVAPT